MNFINFLETIGVTCGDNLELDGTVVSIIRTIFNAIKIGIPIILIIVGSVGMGKAIASQKEDEIKKAQALLIKQAIAAVVIFLMFQLVQILMSVVNIKNTSNWACVSAILTEPKPGNSCTIDENTNGKWKNDGEYYRCEKDNSSPSTPTAPNVNPNATTPQAQ